MATLNAKANAIGAVATMRETLISYLVEDMQETMASDDGFRYDVARDGHIGFGNMSLSDLVKCASDAGLDENHDRVADIIAAYKFATHE